MGVAKGPRYKTQLTSNVLRHSILLLIPLCQKRYPCKQRDKAMTELSNKRETKSSAETGNKKSLPFSKVRESILRLEIEALKKNT